MMGFHYRSGQVYSAFQGTSVWTQTTVGLRAAPEIHGAMLVRDPRSWSGSWVPAMGELVTPLKEGPRPKLHWEVPAYSPLPDV